MSHDCTSRNDITELQKDVAVLQSKMTGVEDNIKGIKQTLSNFTWWFIGILTTVIGGMGAILYQIKGGI